MICISAGRMAYAEGCLPDAAATGTILVDATSSCEALGMAGCSVDGDSGTCTFTGDQGSTTVTIDPNAANDKFDGISWYANGTYGVNWVIINGAAQGGACGYVMEPGKYESIGRADPNIPDPVVPDDYTNQLGYQKSNGTIQSVNSVAACSKLELPSAKLELIKTATADGDCENGNSLLEIVIDRNPTDGEPVEYCYEIKNIGAGDATDVVLTDDNAGLGSSYTSISFDVPAGQTVKSWDDSDSWVFTSNVVTISERGTYINTAVAEGVSEDLTPVSASGKATVEAGVAAEKCPQKYQDLINSLNLDTDNFYAASILLEPKNPGLISLCTPTCSNVEGSDNYDENCPVAQSSRTFCEDDCIWSDNLPGGVSGCTPSDNWDAIEEEVIDPDGPLPYCWEVLESITDGGGIGLKVKSSQFIEIIELSTNPYVYQSCYKSGGRKVCETICYLYDDETSADCPKGSTVY
jgi:hypothetical protein